MHWRGPRITSPLSGCSPIQRRSETHFEIIWGMPNMSIIDDDATSRLKRDFDSYLRGEEPSPSDLACAPLIENWQACVMRFMSDNSPMDLTLVLKGGVTGHPRLGDARSVR